MNRIMFSVQCPVCIHCSQCRSGSRRALLLDTHPDITCVAYASPACTDEKLAAMLKKCVLTAVHNDDVVPRLSDLNAKKVPLSLSLATAPAFFPR